MAEVAGGGQAARLAVLAASGGLVIPLIVAGLTARTVSQVLGAGRLEWPWAGPPRFDRPRAHRCRLRAGQRRQPFSDDARAQIAKLMAIYGRDPSSLDTNSVAEAS